MDKSVFLRKESKIEDFQKQILLRKQDLLLAMTIFNLSLNQWHSSQNPCSLGLIQDQSVSRLTSSPPEHSARQPKLFVGTGFGDSNTRYNLGGSSSIALPEGQKLQLLDSSEAIFQLPNREHPLSVLETRSDQVDDSVSSANWPETSCDDFCHCPCHTIQIFKSPRLFENILGNLIIAYRTFPSARQSCRDFRCQARAGETTCIYTFPPWLHGLALSITYRYTLAQRPELLLRVMLKRDFGFIDLLLTLPEAKILGTMKEMLDSGKLSVVDIDENGETVLRKAIRAHSWNLARLLISYGADINHVDFRQSRPSSPFIKAWSTRWAFDWFSFELPANWDTMFLKGLSSFDIFGFSTLHKAYLGLNGLLFDNVLEAVNSQHINASDSLGRTVLWWACTRGDSRAVEKLLEWGADPEKQSLDGRSPLHLAVQTDVAVAELLLAKKVDVNAADYRGRTPMHFISSRTSSLIKPMMRLGTILETRDQDGDTPLIEACFQDQIKVVAELLACGADINICNFQGNNSILMVICRNHFDILSMLLSDLNLRFGASHRDCFMFFTFVAFWTYDIRIFDVLKDKWPIQTDFEARFDIDRALGNARWRRDYQTQWSKKCGRPRDEGPESWYSMFEDMISTSVEKQRQAADEGIEIWEDARERQEVIVEGQ